MRLQPPRPLIPVLAAAVVAAVAAWPVAAPAQARTATPNTRALPRPATDNPAARGARAPIGGEVRGLTGDAARQAAGPAAEQFRRVTADRLARSASQPDTAASTGDATPLASQLHTHWGVQLPNSKGRGLNVTQSVLPNVSALHGGDYVYAPTALPPGKACIEMTTAYTPSGSQVWAWDWCGGRDDVGKLLRVDSTFLSKYTTTVNGASAYSFYEDQTSAATNAWTSYLYNYATHSWDTFYTSSGTFSLTSYTYGWNIFEIYTSVDASTRSGYYCNDLAGKSFESLGAEVYANGAWTPLDTANSTALAIKSGSTFDCAALSFSLVHPNDHWRAQIGTAR